MSNCKCGNELDIRSRGMTCESCVKAKGVKANHDDPTQKCADDCPHCKKKRK